MSRHFKPAASVTAPTPLGAAAAMRGQGRATDLANLSIDAAEPRSEDASAPQALNPLGNGPRCDRCSKNVAMCRCDWPEPEAEYFRPGLNRDPDLIGWAASEEAALSKGGPA